VRIEGGSLGRVWHVVGAHCSPCLAIAIFCHSPLVSDSATGRQSLLSYFLCAHWGHPWKLTDLPPGGLSPLLADPQADRGQMTEMQSCVFNKTIRFSSISWLLLHVKWGVKHLISLRHPTGTQSPKECALGTSGPMGKGSPWWQSCTQRCQHCTGHCCHPAHSSVFCSKIPHRHHKLHAIHSQLMTFSQWWDCPLASRKRKRWGAETVLSLRPTKQRLLPGAQQGATCSVSHTHTARTAQAGHKPRP
jgi:hypothetical protein